VSSTTTTPRRRLAPEARTAEIMAAARVLLREVGYEKFLPAELARRCGVTEPLIYKYFPTKRDLLARVVNEWYVEIMSVEVELEGVEGTYPRLRHLVAFGLEVVRKEPELTRYMFSELRTAPDYRTSDAHELNRGFTNLVVQLVREAVDAGEFRAGIDPHTVRDMIFGAIEHRTWSYLRGEGAFPVDQTADEIATIIHGGMSVVPHRP
jgi:TetR/AcrR family fatty acid metabolism transcriptional regulator